MVVAITAPMKQNSIVGLCPMKEFVWSAGGFSTTAGMRDLDWEQVHVEKGLADGPEPVAFG
jgi:hypothetical protein